MKSVYVVEYELRSSDQCLTERPRHRGSFIFDTIDSNTDPKLLIKKLTGWSGEIKIHVAQRIVHTTAEVFDIKESETYQVWHTE